MSEHLTLNRRPNYNSKISGCERMSQNDYPFQSGNIGEATYEFDSYTRELTVLTHGMPFGTLTDGVVSGLKLSKQIKKAIDEEKLNVNRILLASCYGAVGGAFSQGQVVADRLNVPVTAYLTRYTTFDGRAFDNGGGMKQFKPKKNIFNRLIGSTGNDISSMGSQLVYNVSRLFRRGSEPAGNAR